MLFACCSTGGAQWVSRGRSCLTWWSRFTCTVWRWGRWATRVTWVGPWLAASHPSGTCPSRTDGSSCCSAVGPDSFRTRVSCVWRTVSLAVFQPVCLHRSQQQRRPTGRKSTQRQPELELRWRRPGGDQHLHRTEEGLQGGVAALQTLHVQLLAEAAAAGGSEPTAGLQLSFRCDITLMMSQRNLWRSSWHKAVKWLVRQSAQALWQLKL